MPLTRLQKKRSAGGGGGGRRDDNAPDLFEPSAAAATTHRSGPGRQAQRPAHKRPATTSSLHRLPPTNKKQRSLSVARRATTLRSRTTARRPNLNDGTATSLSSSESSSGEDENSTTTASGDGSSGVVAKVTPAAARVRPNHHSMMSSSSMAMAGIRPLRLPDDVVDIFATTTTGQTTLTAGDDDTAASQLAWESADESMRNYVTGFLRTYGPEYYHQIYEQEDQEYQDHMAVFHNTTFTTTTTTTGATAGDAAAADAASVLYSQQFHMTDPPTELESALPFQPLLTVKMRHVLVAWLAEVTAEFKLSQCAYHLAVALLDELLLMGPTLHEYKQEQDMIQGLVSDDEDDDDDDVADHFLIKPRNFQAVGCACIWIASKIEDRTPPTSDQLNFISDNACSTETLIQLEARILELLKFRPLRITPVHFLEIHERASQASTAFVARRDINQHQPQFHHMIQYILQLACSNYQLSHEKPSLVAAAACFLTRATLGLRSSADEGSQIWTPTLEFYTGYPLEVLSRVVVLLLMCYMEAEKLNSALYTIYRLPERYRVSLKTAPRIESLKLPGVPTECGTYESLVEMIDDRKTSFLDEV